MAAPPARPGHGRVRGRAQGVRAVQVEERGLGVVLIVGGGPRLSLGWLVPYASALSAVALWRYVASVAGVFRVLLPGQGVVWLLCGAWFVVLGCVWILGLVHP